LPYHYTINVGGADHPVLNWSRISAEGAPGDVRYGYANGKDPGGEEFVGSWVTYGTNFARGKPYTVSVPSGTQWGAGDPEGTRLTDGIAGPPYPGGTAPGCALLWNKGQTPRKWRWTLERAQKCAFRIQLGAGWPWWDALKGQVQDKVEVADFARWEGVRQPGSGEFQFALERPAVNHLWPDEEVIAAHFFRADCPKPVQARYVRSKSHPGTRAHGQRS